MKNVRFTRYAEKRIRERSIDRAWILSTLENPERREVDPDDPRRERLFRKVAEFGERWMRLVIEETSEEIVVVTIFFDRDAGRRRP